MILIALIVKSTRQSVMYWSTLPTSRLSANDLQTTMKVILALLRVRNKWKRMLLNDINKAMRDNNNSCKSKNTKRKKKVKERTPESKISTNNLPG